MKKRTEGEISMVLETMVRNLENDTEYSMAGISAFRDDDATSQAITFATWDELTSEMEDVTGDAPKRNYRWASFDAKDIDSIIEFLQYVKKWINK